MGTIHGLVRESNELSSFIQGVALSGARLTSLIHAAGRGPAEKLKPWLMRRAYARSGNPIWAWRALAVANRAGLDPPAWVMTYLGGVAERMATLGAEPDKNKRNAALAKALELKGNVVKTSEKDRVKLAAYVRYAELMAEEQEKRSRDGKRVKKSACIDQVAGELRVSPRAVTHWLEENEEFWLKEQKFSRGKKGY